MRDIDLLETCLEYGGPEVTWEVPLDKAMVQLGSPVIYDGAIFTFWTED
jgi:hypothetical protein